MARAHTASLLALMIFAARPAQAQDFELPAGDADPEDVEDAPAPPPPPAIAPPPPAAPPTKAPQPPPPPKLAPPRVLVVVRGARLGLEGRARALGAPATAALAKRARLPAARLDAALVPDIEERRARLAAEARAEVLSGLEAFEMLDLDESREVLQDAVESLLAELPHLGPAGRKSLAMGLFGLATTVLFDGETVRADTILVALAAIEPGFSPEDRRYPSNVVERFERVRGRIAQQQTGTLVVKTNPPGARVLIDGGARGFTPLEIKGLAVGQHAVTLEHPAFMSVGRLVPIVSDGPTELTFPLGRGPGTKAFEALGPDLVDAEDAAVIAATAKLDADRVAVVRLDQGPGGATATAIWVDVAARRVLGRVAPRDLSADPATASHQLAAAILGAERAGTLDVPVATTEDTTPIVLHEAWWFWAGVGAVVLAGAITAGWALSRPSDDGPPRNTAIFRF